MRPIGDKQGPHNFGPRSSDEDDTGIGITSLTCPSRPSEDFELDIFNTSNKAETRVNLRNNYNLTTSTSVVYQGVTTKYYIKWELSE
ncbi:hypothetical protein TNCV_134311 [Trichonephila clavipes]|nr:hypothetical protein TNCV_134311 [Trichonephila clavipes]